MTAALPMKVVSSEEMARIELAAYKKGAKEEEFMEAAGRGIALHVQRFVHDTDSDKVVTLLCGKGNNGGDAYVAGRLLHHLGFAVTAYQLAPLENCSPLCRENYLRFVAAGGFVKEITSGADCRFSDSGVIVDGIFGTGFRGVAKDLYSLVIKAANGSRLPIIAIDIPSGLNGQTGEVEGACINAVETVFLGLAKTGFFLHDGWNHVGEICHVDFGLGEESVAEAHEDFILLTESLVSALLPPIIRNRHKYQAGLVIGIAGSSGMSGAALLSTMGALRGGCGIVRLWHPDGMQNELAASPYEVIKVPYSDSDSGIAANAINASKAAFLGPGMGRSAGTIKFLQELLPQISTPCVIDADALYAIAEGNLSPPAGAVLTPHAGEMRRLLGMSGDVVLSHEFLGKCQGYADQHRVTIVLKGGPTFVFHPEEAALVSPRGDAGMATAGSGDVLAGVISALLAQQRHNRDAAALGVYLHGVAGEHASCTMTPYSMTATDILEHLPEAFHHMMPVGKGSPPLL